MTSIESLAAWALAPLLVALLAAHAGMLAAQPAAYRWVLTNEYPPTSLPGEGAVLEAAAETETASRAAIADWEAKVGVEGREVLERFRE